MRWNPLAALFVVCTAALAACDDSTGLDFDPVLVQDTVIVAAPLPQNAGLPTALDITGDGLGGIVGGRFPEKPADAQQWDFAVRIRDGQLSLVPARVIGLDSRAAITDRLVGESFTELREAPGQSQLRSDAAVPLVEGAVYVARSRDAAGGLLGVCPVFAKLSPLEVDEAQGRATIQIVTNTRCGDPRLALE